MTSLSRKKHQTTQPNTAQAKPADQCLGARLDQIVPDSARSIPRAVPRETTWLPAALLATLMMLSSALQAFGEDASQLGWRPAGTAKRMQAQKVAVQGQKQTASRATRIRVSNETDDQGFAVQQVSYDESPQLNRQGFARLKSVVVHPRDPRFAGTGPVRLAQNSDPFGDDIDEDDELSRDILQQFNGDASDTTPDLDVGAMPKPEGQDDGGLDLTPPDGFDLPDNGLDVQDNGLDEPDNGLTEPDNGFDLPMNTGPREPFFDQPPLEPRMDRLPAQARSEMEKELRKAAERHEQAMDEVRADLLSTIDLSLGVEGTQGLNYPWEGTIDTGELYAGRHWPEVTYMWKAAANCHKPLYFEQPQLERYGHSWGPYVQPIVSGAHFFSRIPVLPYAMGIRTPNECVYPLGHYRPGNCAPYVIPAVPFTWRAALFQGGATTGAAFILP